MARFRFRLQTLLDLRERLEEQLKGELGILHARVLAEERRLGEMIDALAAAQQQAADARVGAMLVEDALSEAQYLVRLDQAIVTQRDIIDAVRRQWALKLQEVIAASRDTKALVNLRERQHADYVRDEQRAEQKSIDEVASTRAARVHLGVGT